MAQLEAKEHIMLLDFLGRLFSTTSKHKKDNFPYAVAVVLRHEGGYSNNPKDPGGATNFGISSKFLRSIDFYKKDVKELTEDDAIEIYKIHWWEKYNYDLIKDETIAAKILAMSVNMGANRAHKLVQLALQNCGFKNIVKDGILGTKSFGAINTAKPSELHEQLRRACRTFYLKLIDTNPSLSVFKKGWIKRAHW